MPKPRAPRTTMGKIECVVNAMLESAMKKRRIVNADGSIIEEFPDTSERAKAADVAMRFMSMKHKIDPEEQESEFEREQREFHNPGKGDGDAAPDAPSADE